MKCIISARYRVKIYKLGFDKAFLAFFANLAEMIRNFIKITLLAALPVLAACSTGPNQRQAPYVFTPQPGQGRYVQPEYLRPIPNPTIQPIDLCRAQFYQTLLGQHEGGIYFTGLPGHIRVIKPAETGLLENEFLPDTLPDPPFIEVRDYIPGQVLYTPSIRTVASLVEAGPIIEERITIELDDEGYVEEVRCG